MTALKSFSQRKELTPVRQTIQVAAMDEPLRNAIWNVFNIHVWSRSSCLRVSVNSRAIPVVVAFSASVWAGFFKKPIDKRPQNNAQILGEIRKWYFEAPWHQVYDFIEFVLRMGSYDRLTE